MTSIHVATATDTGYLPWCATALLSAIRATSGHQVVCHVLHSGNLSDADQDTLAALARHHGGEVRYLQLDPERLAVFPTKGPTEGGYISWGRVFLPELLPDLRQVIYLDADTLVLHPLTELAGSVDPGVPFAAVRNVVEPRMRPHIFELGIPNFADYFNAGLLVLNLDVLRADDFLARINRQVDSTGRTVWYDQDALNVVYAGRWQALHPRWNTQCSFWVWSDWAQEVFDKEELEEARTDPGILHFEGPSLNKPWHYLCGHPFCERYRAELALTPWGGVDLQDRTVATRVLRMLPLERRIPAYLRLLRLRAVRSRLRRARIQLGQQS